MERALVGGEIALTATDRGRGTLEQGTRIAAVSTLDADECTVVGRFIGRVVAEAERSAELLSTRYGATD